MTLFLSCYFRKAEHPPRAAAPGGPRDRPYGTAEDYCQRITGHSWGWLLATVAELTDDKELLKRTMMVRNAEAQKEERIQGRHHGANGTMSIHGQGSNNRQKLLRRLARDAPKVLSRYEAGEFPSVRAAAKAAGIVKDEPPFKQVVRLWKKLTPTEKRKLREMPLGTPQKAAGARSALRRWSGAPNAGCAPGPSVGFLRALLCTTRRMVIWGNRPRLVSVTPAVRASLPGR